VSILSIFIKVEGRKVEGMKALLNVAFHG